MRRREFTDAKIITCPFDVCFFTVNRIVQISALGKWRGKLVNGIHAPALQPPGIGLPASPLKFECPCARNLVFPLQPHNAGAPVLG